MRSLRFAFTVGAVGAAVAVACALLFVGVSLAVRSIYGDWHDQQTAECQREGYDTFVFVPGEEQCRDRSIHNREAGVP